MYLTNFTNRLHVLLNKPIVRRSTLLIVLVIGTLVPFIKGYPFPKAFFYFAKWVSFFFIIYYAGLVLASFFRAAPKSNNGSLQFFHLETLTLVYIFLAIYYIGKGACHIDDILLFSWSFSEKIISSLSPEMSDDVWTLFHLYRPYYSVMIGFIVMVLIINCSRSYYQIHELEMKKENPGRNNYWANIDWILRLLIAVAFIYFEKTISHIGMVNSSIEGISHLEIANSNIGEIIPHEGLTDFSKAGMILYSLIIFWSFITAYTKIRIQKMTQFIIGFGGLIFSAVLYVMIKKIDDSNVVVSMFIRLQLYTLMLIPLLASGSAIVIDFISNDFDQPSITE